MKTCDNRCVGVLIERDGRWLVFERATPPVGVAPVAGHVDEHGGPHEAAIVEVSEEVGLTVVGLRLALNVELPNACRRQGGDHHEWWIYEAEVDGDLNPSERETRNADWLTVGELQALADRTVNHAYEAVSESEFVAAPGLEPVWCWLLAQLRLITLTGREADAALALAAIPAVPR